MLERVDVLEGGRKELRRGVRLECELVSDYWDELAPHRLVDLSPSGAFVQTMYPLETGEEVEVRFTPPRSRALYWLRARVVRSSLGRRCPIFDVPGMGLEFLDLSQGDRHALASQLVGIPPRIPMRVDNTIRRPNASLFTVAYELVDIVALDEGVRELLDDGLDFAPLGTLLTPTALN